VSIDQANATSDVPPHVPPELVRAYDHVAGPEIMEFPPAAATKHQDVGRAFFSSCHGGFWVFTRYEDIRSAFQDHELFPQWGRGVPENPFSRVYIPLNLNPPEHHSYRKILMGLLSPRRVRSLEDIVRQTARERVAEIAPIGRCELVGEFAMAMPASMFCGLLGLPHDQFESFHQMSWDLVYTPNKILVEQGIEAAREYRRQANKRVEDFIWELVRRRKDEAGDDMISYLLGSEVDGRPLTDDEVFNMSTLMFFAGTDSTGSAIAYAFAYLAQHPEHRRRIVEDPSIIPQAADELLRFHGFHHINRQVSRDAEFAGVQLRKGDLVLLPTGCANRDPEAFPEPDTVDFDRKAKHHLTFGAGVHRCIGAPLATLELKVALEEFHKVIPDYGLDPDGSIEYASGQNKTGPHTVPLVYPPAR